MINDALWAQLSAWLEWLAVSWTSVVSIPVRRRVLLSLSVDSYSWITSTNSPAFCMTTFRASLTNLTALLLQSHDCSCYVSRRILASPPLWLQYNTDLCAQDFLNCPDLWHQPRLAKLPASQAGVFVKLLLLYYHYYCLSLLLVNISQSFFQFLLLYRAFWWHQNSFHQQMHPFIKHIKC